MSGTQIDPGTNGGAGASAQMPGAGPDRSHTPTHGGVSRRDGLSIGGLFRSEWIKLWTLRSTYWCFGIAAVLTIGFGFLVAVAMDQLNGNSAPPAAFLEAATAGLSVAELVVAVLGALVVTGEYGTGMIRTTFLAAPRRYEPLGAKALVFGVVAFLVGVVSVAISALVTWVVLVASGLHPSTGGAAFWLGLLGGAGAVGLVGMLAVGIGMLVRNTAAAITLAVGVLFVLPIIVGILAGVTQAHWVAVAQDYLPNRAAALMATLPAHGTGAGLDPWQAALVMAAWAGLATALGLLVADRRDA